MLSGLPRLSRTPAPRTPPERAGRHSRTSPVSLSATIMPSLSVSVRPSAQLGQRLGHVGDRRVQVVLAEQVELVTGVDLQQLGADTEPAALVDPYPFDLPTRPAGDCRRT